MTIISPPLSVSLFQVSSLMADLHIFFLPFLAPGHMIPMVDLAKLFAARGVKATIVTTNGNVSRLEPSLHRSPHPIQLLTVPFPPSVPENVTQLPTSNLTSEFKAGLESLKIPFERLLIEHRPDCIVTDIFYPWSAGLAAEHDIPRVVFHGSSSFTSAVADALLTSRAHESVSEGEYFVVPGIPHRIELLKSQLGGGLKGPDELGAAMMESFKNTYGIVMNTFSDMEPGYTTDVRPGAKTWLVGPVGLCNRDTIDGAVRGGGRERELDRCLKWLDSKNPDTVLYVCFGSEGQMATSQLGEIARGLNSSDRPFIWVVRNTDWMPEGLEEKGLIVRGWAPQMAILGHSAVGGFLTHCGWNSCLEGATSGVPMITWPLFADQFFNERLLVDVVRIGLAVGAKVNTAVVEERPLVSGEVVKKAIEVVMGSGEEAEERRKRAKEVAKLARKAVEEGGTSYNALSNMIHELKEIKVAKTN